MALTDFVIGTLLSAAAAILFGVHTSFSKVKADIPMTIYNVYYLFGSSITCLIEYIIMLALGETIHFTYLGIIAALLLLFFIEFYLLSAQKIGTGYATGFTVFSACITAPIAQYILNQPVKYWYFMVVGLFILSLSVFMISMFKDIFKYFGIIDADSSSQNIILPGGELPLLTVVLSGEISFPRYSSGGGHESFPLFSPQTESKMKCGCDLLLGLLFSSLSGICMDLLPFPSLYARENSRGLKFFLSFGIGCIVVMPLCAVMIILDDSKVYKNNILLSLRQLCRFDDEIWHYKNVSKVIIPSVTAGFIWSIGNICCFLSFLYLNYTIAVSYVQCQVIVALFCRVIVWREIRNQIEVAALLFSCLLFLGGCVMVVYGSFGSFHSLTNV